MSPENFENISNFKGWGLTLLAYEKKSVCEPESNERVWRGCHDYVNGVDGVLTWLACYYHCFYWNAILKEKMLKVYFRNNKKITQIDLKIDLKEEHGLKSKCSFALLEPIMLGSWICLNPNVGKYASLCVTLWIYLNMCERLPAYISQSSKYVWICLMKIQNMHELLLSSVWNWQNMSTVLNMPK